MRIVFISDTHNQHKVLKLPDGDLLIHAGDFSGMGRQSEVTDFIYWFQNIKNFDHKIFISGNHDLSFEKQPKPDWLRHLLFEENLSQSDCAYLEDDSVIIDNIKIYGSPWQPEFLNWGFNLPRNGKKLKEKWNLIPNDTDILITHGPPQTILDKSGPPYNEPLLGCNLLYDRIKEIKPKIHACGHIHGGYGYYFDGVTHFINASVLNERYQYKNKPIVADWDNKTNEIKFL